MSTKRLIVLGFAGVMAIVAALLARGMMGGGTPKVEARIAPQVVMSDVLVANASLQPGQSLTADQVRWMKWPATSVDPTFITRTSAGSIDDVVKGTVVRSPIVSGQPITSNAIVHGNAAGFMAAMLNPGMRAISITITADSGAGGFILPNDRIDLIVTRKADATRVSSSTILTDIRVLAVDQTFKQDKDTKTVVGKTATLEVSPGQAELVAKAQNQGALSLALRPLTNGEMPVASNASPGNAGRGASSSADGDSSGSISIIRYGIAHDSSSVVQGGKPQ